MYISLSLILQTFVGLVGVSKSEGKTMRKKVGLNQITKNSFLRKKAFPKQSFSLTVTNFWSSDKKVFAFKVKCYSHKDKLKRNKEAICVNHSFK